MSTPREWRRRLSRQEFERLARERLEGARDPMPAWAELGPDAKVIPLCPIQPKETTVSETKEIALGTPAAVDVANHFSQEQYELIRSQIAPKATPDELKLFLYQAARTGLDPLSRQIYAIHRMQYDADKKCKVPKMTIQTSIDGFRLLAERTGSYAPGPETQFTYSPDVKDSHDEPRVKSATAFVLKRTQDGTWHTVAATAHFWEYAQAYDGKLTQMWDEKPHIMLSKCAEALALRKAFPAEMSGIYTADEMGKADEGGTPPMSYAAPPRTPAEQAAFVASNARAAAVSRGYDNPNRRTKEAPPVAESPKEPTSSTPAKTAEHSAGNAPAEREPGADDDDESTEYVDCYKQVGGFALLPLEPTGPEPKRTLDQNAKMHALFAELEIEKDDEPPSPANKNKGKEGIHTRIYKRFGKTSTAQLSKRECDVLISRMEKQIETNRRLHGAGTPSERRQKWQENGLVDRGDGTWGQTP